MFDKNRMTEFQDCVKKMLEIMGEDPNRDGLLNTPKRVAKAYEFITQGYSQSPLDILGDAMFESSNNEMVLIKKNLQNLAIQHLLVILLHLASKLLRTIKDTTR